MHAPLVHVTSNALKPVLHVPLPTWTQLAGLLPTARLDVINT